MLTLQICQRKNEGGWRIDHEPKLGTYITKNNLWASFNDVTDIEEKSAWILERQLGGASVLKLAHDDSDNSCGCGKFPLVTAINRAFGRIHNNTTNTNCSLLNNHIEHTIE